MRVGALSLQAPLHISALAPEPSFTTWPGSILRVADGHGHVPV